MFLDILPPPVPWPNPPPHPPPGYDDVVVMALLSLAIVLLWVCGYSRSRSR